MNMFPRLISTTRRKPLTPVQLIRPPAQKKIRVRFVIALALLLLIGAVSYETTLKFRDAEQWETQIEMGLDRLNALSSLLKDVESDQQGYLITGDQRYLVRYQEAARQIDQELADMQQLTADDPGYQQKIGVVVPLIAAKIAEIDQTNQLRKSQGFAPAAQLLLAHDSKQAMDDIQGLIGELRDERNQLLREKAEVAEARAQTINVTITFGSFLAIVLALFMISSDIIERKRADEALRESAARFRRLAENALDMIYRYRLLPTPAFEYVSPAATAIIGYGPEDFYADPQLGYKLVHPEDWPLIDSLKHPSESNVPLTVRWMHKNGGTIWTSQQLVPIRDAEGNLVAIEGIVRDVTERMQAYQTLERRVEERTHEIERRRQVAEGLREIMTILNSNRSLDEILDSIVVQACRLLNTDAGAVYHLHEQEDLLCTQVTRGLDADDAAECIPVGWGAVGHAALTREPVVIPDALAAHAEERELGLAPQQSARLTSLFRRYGALLVVPLIVKDDFYGTIALYYHEPREITLEDLELAVAFGDHAALAIENARLRTQAEQTAVAAERSRLARDLHDAVTQTLFSTSLIADVLPRLWERNREEAQRRLDELRQLTRNALAEMRALLLELRPASLTEVGIGELLRQLTDATAGHTRIPIALTVDGQCHMPPDVQIAFYRIAQETLNNVARHANASHAAVRLRCQNERIELQISDDGQGFDPSIIPLGHLGLGIMRERAESIDADLRIESQPGAGTRITITWP